jgi:hypothetical protein
MNPQVFLSGDSRARPAFTLQQFTSNWKIEIDERQRRKQIA